MSKRHPVGFSVSLRTLESISDSWFVDDPDAAVAEFFPQVVNVDAQALAGVAVLARPDMFDDLVLCDCSLQGDR